MEQTLRATLITVSDEIHSGVDVNRAGPIAVDLLAAHQVSADLVVVPDDVDAITRAVLDAVGSGARIVITSGGTGLTPTDVTVDAVQPLLTYTVPGICEEIRRRGAAAVPISLVSREVAGVIRVDPSTGSGADSAFVLTAPGSRGGVRDAIAVVGPLLGYIVGQLDGAARP